MNSEVEKYLNFDQSLMDVEVDDPYHLFNPENLKKREEYRAK